jgi:hypothetical protein
MKPSIQSRILAGFLAVTMAAPVIGCGKPEEVTSTPPGPQNAPYGSVPPPRQAPQQTGMSTQKKLALLAGAAALIYMYNKRKNAKGTGAQGKYYLSKNGRVYYRDAKGNAIWVTPPKGGIQVPQEEAAFYNRAAANKNWNAAYSGPASSPSMAPMSAPMSAPMGGAMRSPSAPPGPPGPR